MKVDIQKFLSQEVPNDDDIYANTQQIVPNENTYLSNKNKYLSRG